VNRSKPLFCFLNQSSEVLGKSCVCRDTVDTLGVRAEFPECGPYAFLLPAAKRDGGTCLDKPLDNRQSDPARSARDDGMFTV
jgi:hypothetical protein